MKFELTKHAKKVLTEREIPFEWLERTLAAPKLVLPDPDDAAVERRFRRIPEFGNRVLRVAVNTAVSEPFNTTTHKRDISIIPRPPLSHTSVFFLKRGNAFPRGSRKV
jgi:hypothetical protein